MLVPVNFKVLRSKTNRHLRAASEHGVLDCSLQIDLERIAEFVNLSFTKKVAISATGVHLMVTHAVFLQVGKDLFQGFLADTADAPGS